MAKDGPWANNDERIVAESLMSKFAARWPAHCPNPACHAKHCSWHKNSVVGKNGLHKRVYRRACGKHTVSCDEIIKTIGHLDVALSSQVMPTYFTQPISTQSIASAAQPASTAASTSASSSAATRTVAFNGNQSLHMSDLDTNEYDQDGDNFIEDTENDTFQDVTTLSSFNVSPPNSFQSSLHFGPSQRPVDFQSPPSFPIQFQGFPGYQMVSPQQPTLSFPSFPALPGSPAFTFTPSPMNALQSGPATAGPSSVVMGKRKKLDASLAAREDPSAELAMALQANEKLNAQILTLQESNRTLQAENGALRHQLDAFTSRFDDQDVLNKTLASAVKELQDALTEIKQSKATDKKGKAVVRGEGHPSSSSSSPPSSSVAPAATTIAAKTHVSYASALSHNLSAEQMDLIKQMKPAPRPFASKTGSPRVVSVNTPTVRLYFGNMQSCQLRVLKERLRVLRVRTSAIHNFAFVGKTICEMLVESSYKDALIAKLQLCTFKYLPNYNPAIAQDPHVSVETRQRLKEAYAARLKKTVSETTKPVVRAVYLKMMADSNIPVPADLPDLTATAPVVDASTPTASMELVTEAVAEASSLEDEEMVIEPVTGNTAVTIVSDSVIISNE